jgi:sucrose-phosphate synthase
MMMLDGEIAELESFSGSLQDAHEHSLRLSIDAGGSFTGSGDMEKRVQQLPPQQQQQQQQNGYGGEREESDGYSEHLKKLIDRVMKKKVHESSEDRSAASSREECGITRATSLSKSALLRKRKCLYVVALDSYGRDGQLTDEAAAILKSIFTAVRGEGGSSATRNLSCGFILSSALSASEIMSFLERHGIKLAEFDALVCCSGSGLYYPIGSNENASNRELQELRPDLDYEAHIDYRWSKQGLRKTIDKLINAANTGAESKRIGLVEDHHPADDNNPYCIQYIVKDPSNVSYIYAFDIHMFSVVTIKLWS